MCGCLGGGDRLHWLICVMHHGGQLGRLPQPVCCRVYIVTCPYQRLTCELSAVTWAAWYPVMR